MQDAPDELAILDTVSEHCPGNVSRALRGLWMAHTQIWQGVHTREPTARQKQLVVSAGKEMVRLFGQLAVTTTPWRHMWAYHAPQLLLRWGSLWVFGGWSLEASMKILKRDFARSIKSTIRQSAEDLQQVPETVVVVHTPDWLYTLAFKPITQSGVQDMVSASLADMDDQTLLLLRMVDVLQGSNDVVRRGAIADVLQDLQGVRAVRQALPPYVMETTDRHFGE
jgi:hypothetical protein